MAPQLFPGVGTGLSGAEAQPAQPSPHCLEAQPPYTSPQTFGPAVAPFWSAFTTPLYQHHHGCLGTTPLWDPRAIFPVSPASCRPPPPPPAVRPPPPRRRVSADSEAENHWLWVGTFN